MSSTKFIHSMIINEPSGVCGIMVPQRSGSTLNMIGPQKLPFISRVTQKDKLGLPPVNSNLIIDRGKRMYNNKKLLRQKRDIANRYKKVDINKVIEENTAKNFWRKNINPFLELQMKNSQENNLCNSLYDNDQLLSKLNEISYDDRKNFGLTRSKIMSHLTFEESQKMKNKFNTLKRNNSTIYENESNKISKKLLSNTINDSHVHFDLNQKENSKEENELITNKNINNKNKEILIINKNNLNGKPTKERSPNRHQKQNSNEGVRESSNDKKVKLINIKHKIKNMISYINNKANKDDAKSPSNNEQKIDEQKQKIDEEKPKIDEEKLKDVKVNMDDLKLDDDDNDDIDKNNDLNEDEMKDILNYINSLDYEKYSKDMEIREALQLLKSKMEKDYKDKKQNESQVQTGENNNVEDNNTQTITKEDEKEKNKNQQEQQQQLPKVEKPIINEEEEKKQEEIKKFKIAEKISKDDRLKAIHSYQSIKKILEREGFSAPSDPLKITVIKDQPIERNDDSKESRLPFLHSLPLV